MAAAAYDVAAFALKGNDAILNFPDHFGHFPVPESSSALDIRSAAGAAAMMMKVGAVNHNDQPGSGSGSGSGTAGGYEYIDEEALFDMPNLLVDMAEGMLVSPPRLNSSSYEESIGNFEWGSLWGL